LSSYTAPPGEAGPIDTVHWEACRVGINDHCYLYTLQELIKQTEAEAQDQVDVLLKLAEIRAEIRDLLKKYGYDETAGWGQHDYSKMSYPETDEERGQGVSVAQFENDRSTLINLIQQVLALSKSARVLENNA